MASRLYFAILSVLILIGTTSCKDTTDSQEHLQRKQTCAKLLSVPAEMHEKYLASEYPEDHDTYCFIRCLNILYGQYDDETGPSFETLHRWFNDGTTLADFTSQHRDCVDQGSVTGEGEKPCKCRKAFRTMMCFREKLHQRARKE